MLYAIVPILDFGKSVTIAYHEGEDTHTQFEGRMQKTKHRIIGHSAHRHIVCRSSATHMKDHHKEYGNALNNLGVVSRELKID